MSLEEFERKPDRQAKRYMRMRSITDFGMGFIYIAIGLVVVFAKQLNFTSEYLMNVSAKIFGVLAIIYGSWRIYRGVRKDYFKKQ